MTGPVNFRPEAGDRLCRSLARCIQRGGRTLTPVDLIRSGTLTLDTAALLAARVAAGRSLLVGARPGGAGKTTVVCALLLCLPPERPLVHADGAGLDAAAAAAAPVCLLGHEIGAGYYHGYLWGEPLRRFFALGRRGHQLVSNLHADTPDEARAIVCGENRVPAADFDALETLVFLGRARGRPVVGTLSLRDADAGRRRAPSAGEPCPGSWRALLARLVAEDVCRAEPFRRQVLAFYAAGRSIQNGLNQAQ